MINSRVSSLMLDIESSLLLFLTQTDLQGGLRVVWVSNQILIPNTADPLCRLDHCPRSLLQIDFVLCDVSQLHQQQHIQPDTVIMNPPFGTKIKGADMQFLRAACSLGPQQIYSLHKSSTRTHIHKVATR